MTAFPTDEMTLRMLISACEVNEETGRSHLMDYLMMGTEEQSRTDITEEVFEGDSAPVYFVEYVEGKGPHSPQDVIITLATELLALRAAGESTG